MGESELKVKTAKGLFWGGMSNGVQQLLGLLFGIYLARTLCPDDYGVVGMLTLFNMIALTLQDGGFVSALINRPTIRHEDYNSVFWFNVLIALGCYIILFFAAPLIARYFHFPALVKVARWSFLSFVIAGFGTAHRAYLSKKLMVREMAMVSITAVVISGLVGVYMAWKGYAYWSLVVQALVLGFLTNVGYWIFSGWHPTFHFDFQPVKEMFRYSVKIMITNILSALNGNFLSLVLGRYYSVEQLGYYTQANKWSTMGSSTLSGMVNSVAHPVLATVVNEKERQLRVFRKMVRFAAFVSFPAMFGLAFIAPEFIRVVLTDKWVDSILLLQILCVAGAFIPVMYIFINLLLSLGNSSQYMWSTIALFVAILATVYLMYPFGITYMVLGISVINILWLFVWFVLVHKEIEYGFRHLLADLLPFGGITLLAIVAAHFLTGGISDLTWRLVAKIAVTAALFVALMWVSRSVTFRECVNILLKRDNKEIA